VPADLEIRISKRRVAEGTRLEFKLHSSDGAVDFTDFPVGDRTLQGDPRDFRHRLFDPMERLLSGRARDGATLNPHHLGEELAKIGRYLYRELFPSQLKAFYWQFRDRIQTLLIVSDEPWIPWELVKPFHTSDSYEVSEDDFLCCRFEMTRWLAGEASLAESLGKVEVGAAHVTCIEAGSPPHLKPLTGAQAECRILQRFAHRSPGVESRVIRDATYDQVEEALRLGGHGIVHFVGHGRFESREPDASPFVLADGRSLAPWDLLGAIEGRIQQERPLVFFNICQAGQQGLGLTRVGGWTRQWVVDCRCGAFIAPQWSVQDDAGLRFAEVFYDGLRKGETIARAVLEARCTVRREMPESTAWLAYTVYAHPQSRLHLNLGPSSLRVEEMEYRPQICPPGALLRAEYGIVPFHSRHEELGGLLDWCHGEESFQVRLYTGAGGMGKSRLALEACKILRQEGWLTGFLFPSPRLSQDEIWRDLMGRGKPALVVVDYAESNQDVLVRLLSEIYRARKGRMRLLLLARAALDWWEQLKATGDGVGEVLSGPTTDEHRLLPLAVSYEDRVNSYRRALRAFGQKLGRSIPETLPGNLEAGHYDKVLLLHMKALVDFEGVPVEDEDGILDHILYRERRFWGRLAGQRGLSEDLASAIGRAMALITLGGGARNEEHGVEIVSALRIFADQKRSVRVQVARLLHESYPGKKWIEPILPDLLGEHLQRRELQVDADELLDLVTGRTLSSEGP
jgi:hypothetical protein